MAIMDRGELSHERERLKEMKLAMQKETEDILTLIDKLEYHRSNLRRLQVDAGHLSHQIDAWDSR